MMLRFFKVSGAGNDFVLLHRRPPGNLPALARRLCDRRTGIGADGLLILERGPKPRLTYLNADGSRAFCGNGARCAAWWMKKHGWTKGRSRFSFKSNAGLITAEVGARTTSVSMPSPKNARMNLRLQAAGKTLKAHYIVIGVPHLIVEVSDPARADIRRFGPPLRRHRTLGPQGANVNFIALRRGRLSVRTYERGVEGETLACGTGATASAIMTFLLGKTKSPVTVKTRGGILKVRFKIDPVREVELEGPARLVHEGTITL